MLTLDQGKLTARTRTLTAEFEHGVITSLRRHGDDKELIRAGAGALFPLQLIYANAEAVDLGGHDRDSVQVLMHNEHRAQIRVGSWYGDGVLDISEDEATGDLIVEPSAYASRPGLRAVRWMLGGVDKELDLIAPFFQGVRLPLEDPLIRDTHWHWPHFWEAGLAILQGKDGGFWIHSRDRQYRYKALRVGTAKDARRLGMETETYGPLDRSLASGGLAWRLNVYSGDWQQPAAQYRDWLEQTWRPDDTRRPDWVQALRLAISWCPCDETVLSALSARLPPDQVLLHIPHWRSDPYDENYPTYESSPEGRAFTAKARGMGFRVMPHFNSIDMDPLHPVYTYIRDFQYRALESKRVEGWTWDGQVKPVMESNAARIRHRDKKTMVKIHPGLSMWRSLLAEHVHASVRELDLEAVFLDVTLNTWNLDNCLVENMTPSEGMNRLIETVAACRPGLAMGGEGRNELTMQKQCFGQVHLFKSWQDSVDGLERCGGCALNEFLFGRWCRSFGYSNLNGKTDIARTRMDLHDRLGAIPTLTIGSGRDIAEPNPAVSRMLDRAING